jgi:type I restriction enzyme S subunit
MMIQENLPNDWEYLPIRSIFTESDTRCGDNQYDLLSVTQDRGIIKQSDVDIKKDISNDDKSKYKVVLKDSIAYNKMRMWQGAVGINEIDDGIVSPAYVVINPTKEMNTKFYYYLFKTPYMISQFGKYSYGLVDDMNSLRYDDFQKIYIPIPPIEEQNKIVNFIDKKSTNIEKFIQDKTRFIELLKEQKEAVINEAVTKGVDNSVEFKDSGIKWLGKIPKHWNITKLKWISKTSSGGTPTSTNFEYYQNGTIPWIRTTDLNNDKLYDTPIKITIEALNTTACKLIKKNSVLIAMYGGGGTIGKNAHLMFDSTVNQAVCAVTPLMQLNSIFLHYYIQFYRPYLMIDAEGSRKDPNISQDTIANIKIPFPPVEEQEQIAKYIENELNQIDKLIAKTTKEIELIKEYKTSLINEAVSGKIKVC